MLLITIFVELRVVAGRSRTQAGSPQTVSRRPCCAVALRRTAWSQQGTGVAWQVWVTHGPNVQIKWDRHILNPYRHGMTGEQHGHGMLCVNRPLHSNTTHIARAINSPCEQIKKKKRRLPTSHDKSADGNGSWNKKFLPRHKLRLNISWFSSVYPSKCLHSPS